MISINLPPKDFPVWDTRTYVDPEDTGWNIGDDVVLSLKQAGVRFKIHCKIVKVEEI